MRITATLLLADSAVNDKYNKKQRIYSLAVECNNFQPRIRVLLIWMLTANQFLMHFVGLKKKLYVTVTATELVILMAENIW